ncbi:hypothetical protein BDY19DRAFT_894548 [Irpex rosettiformis]|uniref:Uncharacterized protein n=1 Tax=Irpex rosettiformis TaxID=378272 RepID=A0ACB8TXN4_9APHY|nr:hypothetical protein BDY19DRAFT_894548 [Irpex rosettiformis]
MTRRSWTTEEQRAWLLLQTKAFIEARDSGAIAEWRGRTYQKWFEQFPEPEPTAEQVQAANGDVEGAKEKAIQKRKTQVVTWFQNHNRGLGSGAGGYKILPLCKS